MLYVSKDSLSDFEFHDADVKSAQFKNGNLYLEVKHLNIHKNTEQNQLETDMECMTASVVFHNAVIASYTPSRAYKVEDGAFVPVDDEAVVYTGKLAKELFLKEANRGFCIYNVRESLEGKHRLFEFDAGGIDPFFGVSVYYDSVEISWDGYEGKAWWEERRQNQ